MTDKTKLVKAKNNLLEFIEDKTKDIMMLLRTEKQNKISGSFAAEDIIKRNEKILEESRKWTDRVAATADDKKRDLLIEARTKEIIYSGLGNSDHNKLLLNDEGIKFILENNEEISDLNQSRVYSELIKRYAQKLEFPWDGGLDDNNEVYITYHKFPKLRSEVVNFMSLLKQYLLLTIKEKYNVLTLDIIPDSQNTFLAIFSMGNKVNEKMQNDAREFFQEKLEDVFENVFIDKTSEHFNLQTKGLGIREIEQARTHHDQWFNGNKEEWEKFREHERKTFLEDLEKHKKLKEDVEKGGTNIDKLHKWIDQLSDQRRKNLELEEYEFELLKANMMKITKLINNNALTISALMKLEFETNKKIDEHPFAEEIYGERILKEFDPSITIKPIFIERSKRQRFETVAEKRLKSIETAIGTFNNFFSKTNVANYNFSKDDMIGIDERITKAVNTFRLNYEQFFASNPEKTDDENSKVKKYKKNIDGTDPLIIKNIKDNMKGGD